MCPSARLQPRTERQRQRDVCPLTGDIINLINCKSPSSSKVTQRNKPSASASKSHLDTLIIHKRFTTRSPVKLQTAARRTQRSGAERSGGQEKEKELHRDELKLCFTHGRKLDVSNKLFGVWFLEYLSYCLSRNKTKRNKKKTKRWKMRKRKEKEEEEIKSLDWRFGIFKLDLKLESNLLTSDVKILD